MSDEPEEVRAQLYVALDVGHLAPEQFHDMFSLAEEVGRLIGGYRVSLLWRLEQG